MTDREILEAWKLGYGQFWCSTPEHANPYLMGRARRDLDLADLYSAGWKAAEREAQAVDRALERMGADL